MRLGGDNDENAQFRCAVKAAATWWNRDERPSPILFRSEGLLTAPALEGL